MNDQINQWWDTFHLRQRWVDMLSPKEAYAFGSRWERAVEMWKHHVVDCGQGWYQVESATDPAIHYRLTLNAGCTCPDTRRAAGGWCKHRLAAWMYREHLRHQEALCRLEDGEWWEETQQNGRTNPAQR